MGEFKLSTGNTFIVDGNDGKYARVLIERKYLDGNKEDLEMREIYKDVPEEKIVVNNEIYDFDNDESFNVQDTFILAENVNYKKSLVTDYYDGNFSINIKHKHCVLLEFNYDGWKKRLDVEWEDSGSNSVNFFEYVSYLKENLAEDLFDGKFKTQGIERVHDDEDIDYTVTMYNDLGEFKTIFIRESELMNSLVGISLVDYEYEII